VAPASAATEHVYWPLVSHRANDQRNCRWQTVPFRTVAR